MKIGLSLMVFAILLPASVYAVPGILTVDLDGTSVDVSYDAEGLQVLTAEVLEEGEGFASLILGVDVTGSPGILEITFDRAFFDAKLGDGNDDEFFIIADGFEELSFEETKTMSDRTLRIELAPGTEELEIFGTTFGEPETMVEETMAEEPMEEETIVEETMQEETMEEETMEEETMEEPKTQCGPGTILKNGVCVLEEKCGPGTIFQDGVCVASASTSSISPSISRDFIVGGGAALGISFVLMLILGLISRAGRQKS